MQRSERMHVLLIEDDPVLGRAVERGLAEAGYSCQWERGGKRGLAAALKRECDIVLLDLMLPDLPGLELLAELGRRGIRTPVIILTALGAVEERVAGLKAGADDYLVKPFAFSELLARLDAVSRRALDKPATTLDADGISLDLTTRRVTQDGRVVELTPTEFSILELLLRFAGHVVTRKMLYEHVWGFSWDGSTNVIEVHVNRLRQKLDGDSSKSCIQTVRGRGYAFGASASATISTAAES